MSKSSCNICNGSRLNRISRNVFINKTPIGSITSLRINDASQFIQNMNLKGAELKIAEKILKEISDRLTFLEDVGLSYLTLERSAESLSGGEAQRIRLASQIGSGLVGVTYVLDEPSIGLHQRDNEKLIKTLNNLKDLGNTVIVVEHDEEAIRCADHIIDIGPGAGKHGGEICAEGTLEDILNNPNSITAKYLSGEKQITIPKKRKLCSEKHINIINSEENNLQNISASIPVGLFTCITGVSGSGKSSLLRLLLKEEKPTSGTVTVDGINVAKLPNRKVPAFRRTMGIVFQDFRLLPGKTVFDNVAFGMEVIGKSKKEIQQRIPAILELVGLEEKAHRLPSELSGGEQQRVALARAFVNKPKLLLADEPTGNLDPSTSVGIMKLLDRINRTGTTIVMATHDVAIVDQMRKRIVQMENGKIIRDQERGMYGHTGH